MGDFEKRYPLLAAAQTVAVPIIAAHRMATTPLIVEQCSNLTRGLLSSTLEFALELSDATKLIRRCITWQSDGTITTHGTPNDWAALRKFCDKYYPVTEKLFPEDKRDAG